MPFSLAYTARKLATPASASAPGKAVARNFFHTAFERPTSCHCWHTHSACASRAMEAICVRMRTSRSPSWSTRSLAFRRRWGCCRRRARFGAIDPDRARRAQLEPR
eukprot:6592898-Prymnesium_polylepis.1